MQRESFGSRLGFILISAGCAIGLGNVWRFPYIVGQYGGAAFILIYFAFLIMFGLPIMTMEFSVGRASRKSIAESFKELEPKGTKWHWFSKVGVAGNYLLMMFYTTVTGWMFAYFFKMLRGDFVNKTTEQITNQFGEFTANPDAYASSFYFYRNGDSKIYAGPVWDFDFALANREWCWQVDEKIFTPDESMARRQEAFGENGLREDLNISKLYYYLMDMPEFKDEVIRVYQERLAGRKDEFIKDLRDRADVIRKAANVNNERWERKSFDSDFDELMDFVEKRYEFFEKEFSDGKTVVPLRSAF